MVVYKITNITNGKTYIGATKNFKNRVTYHKTRYDKKKEYNKVLYKAMRKYGLENFKFEILYNGLNKEKAKIIEHEMIVKYKSLTTQNGYNVSPGDNYYNVRGENVNTTILTENEAKNIINRRIIGEKSIDVFKDYEDIITWSAFQQIWRGINWKHLKGQEKIEFVKGNAKFSLAQVKSIKLAFKNGLTASQVAKMFNICYHTAYNIKSGISYSYVTV